MKSMRRMGAENGGQALLEVAILTPVLMLLLIGSIDLGRLAQFDTVLASSARAGAQYGAANLVTAADTTGMKTAATNEAKSATVLIVSASNYCQCYGSTATVACTSGGCASTHRLLYVKVSASGTFKPIFRYFPGLTTLTPSRTVVLQVGQ